jgi:uncharacterized protein (DUF433 family)
MEKLERITWNPNQMNGQPCIRGMRLTVRRVSEALSVSPNHEDLLRNYPVLEPEDVPQALAFAAANLADSNAKRLPLDASCRAESATRSGNNLRCCAPTSRRRCQPGRQGVFRTRSSRHSTGRFKVTDIHADYTRLQAQGVVFTSEPVNAGPVDPSLCSRIPAET